MAGRVSVYGHDIRRAPLCDSSDAEMIVIHGASDTPIMLLFRMQDDVWGLSTPDDADWPAMCTRFGLGFGQL